MSRRLLVLVSLTLFVVSSGCGSSEKSGGSGGSSTAGTAGSSGASGTAGSGGSSGAAGQGGTSTAGTGGAGGSGGSAGSAGSAGIAGSGGTSSGPCTTADDCPGHPTCSLRSCNDGVCSATPDHDGESCDDGDACTDDGVCKLGECKRGAPKDCSLDVGPCAIPACDIQTGCTSVPLPDGSACSDGLFCTEFDVCTQGVCSGSPVSCPPTGNECVPAVCTEPDGACVNMPSNANGAGCEDFNACMNNTICQEGSCVGGEPVTDCSLQDGCCVPGCEGFDPDCCCW